MKNFLKSNEKFVSSSDRQAVVRICVDFLIKEFGHYPEKERKEEMARGIVKAFPCLGYGDDENTKHKAYYNPSVPGYLDIRLKHVRKPLKSEDRKRKKEKEQGHQKGKQRKPKGVLLDQLDAAAEDLDDPDNQYKVYEPFFYTLSLFSFIQVLLLGEI